jgi:hypothetical protein
MSPGIVLDVCIVAEYKTELLTAIARDSMSAKAVFSATDANFRLADIEAIQ